MNDNLYMLRAIELARLGAGSVSPNPMVGAVIVYNGMIIGEGWHQRHGGPHAEVNAVASVADPALLPFSTMYVTLEPCSHHGKTPPCADMIISRRIPRVVVGTADPYHEVCGGGIAKLRAAGIEVAVGILEDECISLNSPFFTYHNLHRPYTILKWAQTADGYLDAIRPASTRPHWFTSSAARTAVHKLRAQCDAIMVGRRTVELDNPSLTTRNYLGRNPLRVTLDRNLTLNTSYNIFNDDAPTILFTSLENTHIAIQKFNSKNTVTPLPLNYEEPLIPQIITALHARKIQSLIVEGGACLLKSFLNASIYDQIDIFTSTSTLSEIYQKDPVKEGLPAPIPPTKPPKSQEKNHALGLHTLIY